MAEGTGSYLGMAVPLRGESEITQVTAATDILTLTGATSQTGDFLVCQNSTGTENLVISSSGLITSVVGATFTSLTLTAEVSNTLSSSAATSAYKVLVTSTGTLDTGATGPVGFLVSQSSKSVLTAAFGFTSGAGSEAGSAKHLLMVDGSKPPTNFLAMSSTGNPELGTAAALGFFDDSLLINTFTCDHPFAGLKIMNGSVSYYLLAAHATGIT